MLVASGTSASSVNPTLVSTEWTRAKTWKRLSPPVQPCVIGSGSGRGSPARNLSTSASIERPKGEGSQSITERNEK